MKRKDPKIVSEWSFMIPVDEVGRKPVHYKIEAGREERKEIARRLGLIELKELRAEFDLIRDGLEHVIHATGRFYADIIQACVVTLDPVECEVEDTFDGWFADTEKTVSFSRARRDRLKDKRGVDTPVLEEYEDPEPLMDGMVDAGELVVQNLSLAMPHYPHKEGAELEDYAVGEVQLEKKSNLRKNPFAALREWKSR